MFASGESEQYSHDLYIQLCRVIHSRKDNHLSGQDKIWINVPRRKSIEKLGGRISHIEFREQNILRSTTTTGIRYSILLQVEYRDDHRPYSLISIKTFEKDIYEKWKSYIQN